MAAARARKRVFDLGAEAAEGAGAVAFEGEQVFAGLEDRFDPSPDRGDVWPLAGLVFSLWADDRGGELGARVFNLAPGVAEIAEHEQVAVALAALEQGQADI